MSDQIDIVFRTDRFNLSEVKPHFINPCCFGEDLAAWLRGKLEAQNIKTGDTDQEDWGWYFDAEQDGAPYFIGIGGNSDELEENPNLGEWRVMLKRHRSLKDRFTGKNKELEPFALLIEGILKAEPNFRDFQRD